MDMQVTGSIFQANPDICFEWQVPWHSSFCSSLHECRYFYSPLFAFSGCSWRLVLFPRSSSNQSGWMPLVLKMRRRNRDETVTFSFGIKKADGSMGCKHGPIIHTFTRKSSYLCKRFIKEDDLRQQRCEWTPSNALTILCLFVNTESAREIAETSRLTDFHTLSPDLKQLFISGKSPDVRIKVQDKEFQVHRAILMARSPVFSSMFEHQMAEGVTGRVDIADCDMETFGDFLKYLYTDETECDSIQKACHLYATCHKYDVQGLKSSCVSYMTRNLTAETFLEVVTLADRYDDSELMALAQIFFNQNSKNIFSTNEWINLGRENFLLANRFLQHMV